MGMAEKKSIHFCGALAGYSEGSHAVGPYRVLVTQSPFIIAPAEGDWTVLSTFLKNLLGDSVFIFYEPINQTLCSNGYAYDLADFEIPDTLFAGAYRLEGEWLVRELGINKYAWRSEAEGVKVTSDRIALPYSLST